MFGAARTAPLTRSGPRLPPVAFSLAVHAGLLGLVAFGPPPHASRRPRSLYDQVIKPREHELVWYSFHEKLPEVSPPENLDRQPPGVELNNPKQTIVANSKQGERGAQMIWRPLPQVKPQPEVASPNILAFRLPLIPTPPPGPPRKLFVPPPAKPRKPPEPAPTLPEPPKVQARIEPRPLILASLAAPLYRPTPRNFVPPAPKPALHAAAPALPEAPRIATAMRSDRIPLLAEGMAAPVVARPQPRIFIAPAAPARPAAGPAVLPDAPNVGTQFARAGGWGQNAAIQDISAAALANKPKPREFVPPPTASGGGHGSHGAAVAPTLEEAPALNAAGMPSANVNVAVVGLNPSAKLSGPLPDTSRVARFSAGPNANGGRGGDATASSSALSVPGLLVRGSGTPEQNSTVANPLLVARAAPTSRTALEAAARAASAAMPSDPPPTEIHLAPPPDPAFNGRDVYSLAVQMPNITSYEGTWIMWFAEHAPAGPRGSRKLRPPVPLHKVDPKYYQDVVKERVEGKVQLAGVIRADGHVDQVRVLKSVDPRLDRSAEEALLKWEFEPAARNGAPVEVDVVAEIPFVLAPQAQR